MRVSVAFEKKVVCPVIIVLLYSLKLTLALVGVGLLTANPPTVLSLTSITIILFTNKNLYMCDDGVALPI